MVFGVPLHKDAVGSGGRRPRGHPQRRVAPAAHRTRRRHRASWPTCASTSSPTTGTAACSTRTVQWTTMPPSSGTPRWAWPRPTAGAHVVGTSGMMDGQVGVVRAALDAAGHHRRRRSSGTPRSTRRGSTGRSARRSARRCAATARPTSRTTRARAREALAEVALDVAEGADIVMVKPALPYLDILRTVADGEPGARRGLPGQRRVRDGRGRRGERLARPRPRDPRDADVDPACRRVDRSSPTGRPSTPSDSPEPAPGRAPPGARRRGLPRAPALVPQHGRVRRRDRRRCRARLLDSGVRPAPVGVAGGVRRGLRVRRRWPSRRRSGCGRSW